MWPAGLIGSLFSLLQFLSSPVTGVLSDLHGRRPLLLLTTVSLTAPPVCRREQQRRNDITHSGLIGLPCVSVGADVLLRSLDRFPELRHVPFVSGNWGRL